MIILNLNYKRLLVSLLTIALVSCSSPWDDREDNGDANLDVTLNEAITNTAEVSQFGQLLVQTGYDKILAASKTYTVFAPTNESLAQVDPAILNDPEALKKFVANHIALGSFSSLRKADQEKIQMLSDKYLTFKGSTIIDDATIVTADHYAANGVFHIVNKPLVVKLNIWQYVNAHTSSSAMSAYLVSLKQFSIYKEDADAKKNSPAGYLADSLSNSYLRNVYNLNNEKNSYTLFLMEDDGYNAEVTKMTPYLTKTSNNPTIDSTAIYSKYFTVRDLAFPKAYIKGTLPATLTSRFGVQFNVDKTQIVGEPIQLSNGIIYIMKKVDITLEKRLVTTRIEGEKNTGYANGNRSQIWYRDKKDPLGMLFNDVTVQSPGAASFMLYYDAKDLYSTKYKVYWRAINDFGTTATILVPPVFTQNLGIGKKITTVGSTNVISFLTTLSGTIQPYFYDEVYIGEVTIPNAGYMDLTLIANNTTTSPLSLDYMRFVPVIK
ncbi:fasciclin domain-containing protein [Flavobacterium sp. WC2509]|uniref:fasciclin domain-containing protein n=1 Tax=Flavobacterium sp. WC2509 TaxID=3461406 RepID=UPI0040450DB9